MASERARPLASTSWRDQCDRVDQRLALQSQIPRSEQTLYMRRIYFDWVSVGHTAHRMVCDQTLFDSTDHILGSQI